MCRIFVLITKKKTRTEKNFHKYNNVCAEAYEIIPGGEGKKPRWSDKTIEYISHQNKNIDLNLI